MTNVMTDGVLLEIVFRSFDVMIFVLTVQGKKNHYNVKFLKVYGHSISVKNSKIIFWEG